MRTESYTTLDWEKWEKQKKQENELIDEIQEIRTRNNKNWMDILRIAFQYAPDETKKKMADITECDAEINKLSRQLAEGEEK